MKVHKIYKDKSKNKQDNKDDKNTMRRITLPTNTGLYIVMTKRHPSKEILTKPQSSIISNISNTLKKLCPKIDTAELKEHKKVQLNHRYVL